MKQVEISKWSEFLGLADEFETRLPADPGPVIYRGQSNAEWPLKPSLLRSANLPLTAERLNNFEMRALHQFKSSSHQFLSPAINETMERTLEAWAIMQHHGAPTRLLDWTSSIFVAAYFAVHGSPVADGAVWVIQTEALSIRMQEMYDRPDMTAYTREEQFKLRLFDKAAKPFLSVFSTTVKPDRMIVQQGTFTICDNVLVDQIDALAEAFPEDDDDRVVKITIPSKIKRPIARRLRAMNLTASSLFPGIDGLGRSIAELLSIADASDS